MSSLTNYLDPFFDLMGNEDRRHAVFAIHGSEYIQHHKDNELNYFDGCLKTADVSYIIGKDRSTTIYHLAKLEEGGLVKRLSRLEDGKAVLMWRVTDKWLEFVSQFNLSQKIKNYLKKKHPNLYIEGNIPIKDIKPVDSE